MKSKRFRSQEKRFLLLLQFESFEKSTTKRFWSSHLNRYSYGNYILRLRGHRVSLVYFFNRLFPREITDDAHRIKCLSFTAAWVAAKPSSAITAEVPLYGL